MHTPINRNNLFYSEDDFVLETNILENYMEEDTNQTIILYEVDRGRTNVNDVYKETKTNDRIIFKPPKELPCLYNIKPSEIKSFDNKTNNAIYMLSGNLEIYILKQTLIKYNCDIKRGDYIGVQINENTMNYFTVVNDGKINQSNDMAVGAYGYPWLHIECAPSTVAEFDAK